MGGVYKLWPLNILEYTFLLNLAIASTGTLYIHSTGHQTFVVSQISVLITLVVTILILVYHCSLKIKKKIQNTKLEMRVTAVWQSITLNRNQFVNKNQDAQLHPQITYSVVELDEPLINQLS